ncbi:MAG: DUF4190 domain-containing protein [Kofleriaceae bacterium]
MPGFAPPPQIQATRTSGMAITGFVLSFFCGVLGLIFSALGFAEVRKSNGKVTGGGLAIAGIVISIVSLLGVLFIWFTFMRAVDDLKQFGDRIDAEIELERMARSAKQYYMTNSEFPKQSAPTNPSTSCCDQPNGKCKGEWTSPAWREIDFEIWGTSRYRYNYTSTATTFVAEAIGDFDCDGNEVVYRITVDAPEGTPVTSRVEKTGTD